MPKTETELIEAHKNTIEVMTGKKCEIKLFTKDEIVLRLINLHEIKLFIERYNRSPNPITSRNGTRELVNLRKIFCLIAENAGHSASKIGKALANRDHTNILYNLRTAKQHLQKDANFYALYSNIQAALVKENLHLLQKH